MAAFSAVDATHPEGGRVRVSQQADVFSFGALVAVLYGACIQFTRPSRTHVASAILCTLVH